MRVLVDFTSAIGDRTGVGTYTRELVRALLSEIRGVDLGLAVHVLRHSGWHREISDLLAGCPGRWRAAPNRLVPPRLVLEANRRCPFPTVEALFGRCDVFHGTNFLAPPGRRCRTVVTVHDLAFVQFADEIPVPHAYRRYIGKALERADRVLAVSQATADDAVALFGIPRGKVAVVHEGGPTRFPRLPAEEVDAVLERHGVPDRFFLFVGTLEPRKNLVRLIHAYRESARGRPSPAGLVLAGRVGWSCGDVLDALREVRRELPAVHLGFVPERLRNSLYERCLAFVLPSLYEGFGLPVLEAFRAGAPVLCSDAGALPEVAGDAALLVDPSDEGGLADGMVRLTKDPDLRLRLRERGRSRLAGFSWSRAARETLAVYRDAAGDCGKERERG